MKIVTIRSPWCHSNPVLLSCSVKKKDVKQIVHAALVHILKANRNIHIHYVENSSMNDAKRFLLCSTEDRKLHGFGTTWGWVNDDRFSCLGELFLRRTFSSVICYSLTFTNTLMVDGIRFSNSIYLLLFCCESTFIKSKNVCTARSTNRKPLQLHENTILLKCLQIDLKLRDWIIAFKAGMT